MSGQRAPISRARAFTVSEGLPALSPARPVGPGKGQQGVVTCPECGAQVTTKRPKDFGGGERLYSPHRRGGGMYRLTNNTHVRCPATDTTVL